MFRFYSLDFKHLSLIHKWYNLDHVQKYYAKKPLDLSELERKYASYISGKKAIYGFVCYFQSIPIGYIQYYPLKRHGWEGINLKESVENCCGIDLFIGNQQMLGKGVGRKMIETFLNRHVFKKFKCCFVDPLAVNEKAIRCYRSIGFEDYALLVSEENEDHLLMILEKSYLKSLWIAKGSRHITLIPPMSKIS